MLETERSFYDRHCDQWAEQYRGKYLLVKERKLVGAFESMDEALAEGARRFGRQPFLVRMAGEVEAEITVPALTLGLLRAHTP